jgi:hypothetical protein
VTKHPNQLGESIIDIAPRVLAASAHAGLCRGLPGSSKAPEWPETGNCLIAVLRPLGEALAGSGDRFRGGSYPWPAP